MLANEEEIEGFVVAREVTNERIRWGFVVVEYAGLRR